VLSSNQWLTASEWPPRGAKPQRFYLQSAGHANAASGDGTLVAVLPSANESFDEYVSDPLHPVPARGGSCCSEAVAREQSPVEARTDVLVYTTPTLEQPLRIVGEITAHLYVSSSAPDTDLMLKLVDVYPNGSAYNFADTALRLRYRNGAAQPSRLTPGTAYPVEVTGLATEIASSNFPNYERNLQTGGRNFDETRAAVARNRIWHDRTHLSYLELPISSPAALPQ
jgi:putative CocE/NonD family hydrolase